MGVLEEYSKEYSEEKNDDIQLFSACGCWLFFLVYV